MNTEHLAQRILVRRRLQIPIQHVLQHIDERRIVVLDAHLRARFQSQCGGRRLASRVPMHHLFAEQNLRLIVDVVQALAEDGVQPQEQVPVAAAKEQRVRLVIGGAGGGAARIA